MDLKTANKNRWDACHISAEKGPAFKAVADRLTEASAFSRYKTVEQRTGVPWWFVAVVHQREASQSWTAQLGQGDPLNKKSTHVPKGRGPFKTWEDGAVDALVNCAPYAAKNKDWSIGGALAKLEEYNGLGYATKGLPSPYLWAGTDQYVKGKYIADNKYDPEAVDQQLGCAGLLKFMGVFKTAPTGVATAAGAAVVASGGIAAAVHPTIWTWVQSHWLAVGIAIAATAFVVDMAFAIYNNEKNQLKVSNVSSN
jgi:lysozyme family protein